MYSIWNNHDCAMKVILEIPIDTYMICLMRFRLRSREYQMLRNGIISRDDRGDEIVEILCDAEKAKFMRNIIADLCPESLSKINQRPDTPPNS
jgi:hypothetical protein